MKRLTLPAAQQRPNKKWLLIQELFEKAISLPAEEVEEFLDQACAGDARLKQEVLDLLRSFEGGEEEFERASLYQFDDSSAPLPSFQVDGYELLKPIHRGGQGTVYRAVQLSTKREVALKFMLAGQLASEATKLRFEREVELVVGLRHPGIVPVFDSGLADGQYFYVMEFVDGVHLDEFVRSQELTISQVLSLFVEVCDAVNHAQQRGVVHRDLKPSNILVDNRGVPRILDFGLAKSVSGEFGKRKTVSMTGQVMGTLFYMSPEQASGASHEIDTRTDVYSLGVVLYELLTGQLPYALDASLAENLAAIQDDSPNLKPLKASRINGEISTILLKALQKEKDRRYGSAGAMGEDLARYLRGDPIEAKRDSSFYVLRKVLRRNYGAVSSFAAIMLIIIASSVVSFGLYLTANGARERADRNALLYESQRDELQAISDESLEQLYVAEMNLAGQGLALTGGIGRIQQLTNKWTPTRSEHDLRDWEWYFLQSQCNREYAALTGLDWIWCLQWHPSEETIVYGDNRGKVWKWSPGEAPHYVGYVGTHVRSVAWNRNGSQFAGAGPGMGVRVWRSADDKLALNIHHPTNVLTVAWHPTNGNLLAFGDILGEVEIWDVAAKKPIKTWNAERPVQSISWSGDGEQLILGCHSSCIQVWDARLGELRHRVGDRRGVIRSARQQPGGKRIAASHNDGFCLIERDGTTRWDVGTERDALDVCWSPDGKKLATVGGGRVLRLIDMKSGDELARFDGHKGTIWAVDWSPDGSTVATGSEDGSIRLWKPSAEKGNRARRMQPHRNSSIVKSIDWHPLKTELAVVGQAFETFVLQPGSLRVRRTLESRGSMAHVVRWSHSGERLAVAGVDKQVTVRSFPDFKVIQKFSGHIKAISRPETLGNECAIHSVAWSPDDRFLASSCQHGNVLVWDATTGEVIAMHKEKWLIHSLDWHPQLPILAFSSGYHQAVKVWSVDDEDPPRIVTEFDQLPIRVRWSPDGSRLAASCNDGVVKILDPEGTRQEHMLREHTGAVAGLAWNPSGTRLATGSNDLTIKVWDANKGVQVLSFKAHSRRVTAIAWSPDGRQLVSGGADSMVKVWDARSGYEPARSKPALESTELESTGIESTGIESTGIESTGIESTGIESTGIESTGVALAKTDVVGAPGEESAESR